MEWRIERADAGSLSEALAAAVVVVLAILGILGLRRDLLMAIDTIVLGAAFLLEGGAVGTRYDRLVNDVMQRGEQRIRATEVRGGLTAESLAGLVGIALGVLALLDVLPKTLPPIALLAFGAGLFLSSAGARRLDSWRLQRQTLTEPARHEARRVLDTSTTARVVVAFAAFVLGIVAIMGTAPALLTLVGLLAVGCSLLMTGAFVGVPTLVARRHPA